MGRRGDHTFEELSHMIINAAYELMEKEGHSKVSTRKIASHIGYTVGTLYNVYQNLDDIFIHINSRTLDKLTQQLEEAMKNSGKNLALKAVANKYIEFSKENFNLWNVLFEYRFPESQIIPKWYANKIDKINDVASQAIIKNFPHFPREKMKETVMVLWAGVHGICVLSIKGKLDRVGAESAQILVENFLNNYLKGCGIIN